MLAPRPYAERQMESFIPPSTADFGTWAAADDELDSGYSESSDESWSSSPVPVPLRVDLVYLVLYPPSTLQLPHPLPLQLPAQQPHPLPIQLPAQLPQHQPTEPAAPAHSAAQRPVLSIERLIKWSLPPPAAFSNAMPGWKPMPYGLERFWQSAFAWFFQRFLATDGHLWTLQPTVEAPETNQWPWHVASYSAKIRFQCPYKHAWTSMKGHVVFWYQIRRQDERIICESFFKLFGQQCNQCYRINQDFLEPLWYHEEIENAVRFLSTQVAEKYYGGARTQPPRRLRSGRPVNHHDPHRCQACSEGICVIN